MGLSKRLVAFGTPLLAVVFMCLAPAAVTSASTYGGGNYSQCAYSRDCPTAQHTITTTPSGLQIAVNLVEGQTIPASGYTIVVTPLNGSGSSFASVDFYIEGALVHSQAPDPDGTARWFWNPDTYPGTHIEVVATDRSGQTTEQHFTVTFATASTPVAPSHSSSQTGANAAPTSFERFWRQLPPAVVLVFPYLLFLLLLLELLLLIAAARRELQELKQLRFFIEQAKRTALLKQEFLELVSHYLRTPVTILRSGAEGLAAEGVSASLTSPLNQALERVGQTVESLLAGLNPPAGAVVSTNSPANNLSTVRARQNIIVWLPVIAIGIVAGTFVYLADHFSRFSPGTLDTIVQIVVYAILVVGIYQFWRRSQLQRRDRLAAEALLAEQTAAWQERDRLVGTASQDLHEAIAATTAAVDRLPATGNSQKFVREGSSQLARVYAKFAVATRIKGACSTDPYQAVSLQHLFDQAVAAVTAKNQPAVLFQLVGPSEVNIFTRNPGLTVIVLASLLENAAAYSPAGSDVVVSAETEVNHMVIRVTDHGSGLTEEQLGNLFRPFSKGERAETFNHAGMGFSLYLDKLIMSYLGGDISLASAPSQGTTVTLAWQLL
jgi:signal transduction histidine kinase